MEAENRFHIIVGEDIDRGRSVFNHRRFTSVFHLFVPLTTKLVLNRTANFRIAHFSLYVSYILFIFCFRTRLTLEYHYYQIFYNIILDPNFFILHFYSLFLLLYLKSEITESFTYLFIF